MGTRKVLIVGAGPCGLLTLRHCLDMGLNVECVERRENIGGLWGIKPGEKGAMYDYMKTILPKEIMAAPGLSYNAKLPSFLTKDDVYEYFEDYVSTFNLSPYITLGMTVDNIKPIKDNFLVTLSKVIQDKNGQINTKKTVEFYHAVVVCTGNASTPSQPRFDTQELFSGKVMHSSQFVNAKKQFSKDDVVMIVGAKASGWSIAHLVAPHVKKVIVNRREGAEYWDQTDRPENVDVCVKSFQSFYENGLICERGEKMQCTRVIFCTGYKIDLPFLDFNRFPGLYIDGPAYIGPLYNELISIAYPNLMFVGYSRHCLGMNAFDIQARFVSHVLTGKIADIETKIQKADLKPYVDRRGRASISNPESVSLTDFTDNLLRQMGQPLLRPVIMNIYLDVLPKREKSLSKTRKLQYRIIDDNTYDRF